MTTPTADKASSTSDPHTDDKKKFALIAKLIERLSETPVSKIHGMLVTLAFESPDAPEMVDIEHFMFGHHELLEGMLSSSIDSVLQVHAEHCPHCSEKLREAKHATQH